jgi:uncharacterized membrane protein YeaQ/YmgE (transglycosylase-associated protein family)
MSLIMTLIIGGIVGWLASILMKTNSQTGIVGNVVVGVVGSALGLFIANSIGAGPQGAVASWVVAILGAALLIVILRALGWFPRLAGAR